MYELPWDRAGWDRQEVRWDRRDEQDGKEFQNQM